MSSNAYLVYIYIMKYAHMLCMFFVVSPAVAQTDFLHGLSVGVGVSAVAGINMSLGYHNTEHESYWLRHFGMRIDFADTSALKSALDSAIDSYMRNGRNIGDGVKIDQGSLDAWHGAFLLDYYPFAGAWRLSGGYALGNSTLGAAIFGEIANASSNRYYFNLAGDHYYYNGNNFNGVATIDWDYYGAYFGTGFDFRLGCGFGVFLDLGGVLTNRPARIALDIPQEQLYIYDTQSGTWSPVAIPKLESDVARATREANSKLSKIRIFPMIKLGFSYNF